MRIGISAPIDIRSCLKYVNPPSNVPAPSGIGGTPIVHLVEELLRRGRKVTVFTLDRSLKPGEEVVLEGSSLKICVGPYRISKRARDGFAVERRFLLRAIQKENPDVIHAHWTYEFALPALASGIPTVVTAHDSPVRIMWYLPDVYRLVRLGMAWKVAHIASVMTGVSPDIVEHFRKYLGCKADISWVPNGLPEAAFCERTKWGQEPRRPFTFTCIANGWGRRKNVEKAIEAFGLLRKRIPESRLMLVGSGYGDGEEGQIFARERGLTAGVEFVGSKPTPDVRGILIGETDVFVHPAKEEAFCMAILEAMAVGLPIVAGRASGGVPNQLEYGKAGLLVDVSSTREVMDGMLKLANDKSLAESLGKYAYHRCHSLFTTAAMTDAYEAAYEKALKINS